MASSFNYLPIGECDKSLAFLTPVIFLNYWNLLDMDSWGIVDIALVKFNGY